MNVISALMEIQMNPVTIEGKKVAPVVCEAGCLEEVCGSFVDAGRRTSLPGLYGPHRAAFGEERLRYSYVGPILEVPPGARSDR